MLLLCWMNYVSTRLCFGRVPKRSLSAHWMEVKLFLSLLIWIACSFCCKNFWMDVKFLDGSDFWKPNPNRFSVFCIIPLVMIIPLVIIGQNVPHLVCKQNTTMSVSDSRGSDSVYLRVTLSVGGQNMSVKHLPVPCSTCSCRVITYVGKPSAIGQPTRPTRPFILSG